MPRSNFPSRALAPAFVLFLVLATVAACESSLTTAAPQAAAADIVPQTMGTIQIVQGGTGQGSVTSEPAGINCVIGANGPTGTCSAAFTAGIRVRLRAKTASGSEFRGWAPVNSCPKAPDVEVRAGAIHSCQPVFQIKR